MIRLLPIAYGVFVAGLCAATVSTLAPGLGELRAIVRITAFTSAMAFLPAFAASSWHRLRPSLASRWLLANRRYVGLSVAASHLWHLLALIALFASAPESWAKVQATTLAFGGAGFVLLALMALTSTDGAPRALGRAWGALHTTGIWVLWLDFVFTHAGAATVSPFHAVMTAVFLAALVLRITARVRRRRPAAARLLDVATRGTSGTRSA